MMPKHGEKASLSPPDIPGYGVAMSIEAQHPLDPNGDAEVIEELIKAVPLAERRKCIRYLLDLPPEESVEPDAPVHT